MLSRLTSLQQLTMMGCNMQCLPPALAHLKSLRVLYLGEVPRASRAWLSGSAAQQARGCCVAAGAEQTGRC